MIQLLASAAFLAISAFQIDLVNIFLGKRNKKLFPCINETYTSTVFLFERKKRFMSFFVFARAFFCRFCPQKCVCHFSSKIFLYRFRNFFKFRSFLLSWFHFIDVM